MQQVKIFKGLETEVGSLEKQINGWLAESGARVINIVGNIAPQSPPPDEKLGALGGTAWAPSDVLVIVLYEKM
jgi:hypothetical protein